MAELSHARWDRDRVPSRGATADLELADASPSSFNDQLALASHCPRASATVLDSAGHKAQLERPDLIMALLADLLTRADVIKNPATRGYASS